MRIMHALIFRISQRYQAINSSHSGRIEWVVCLLVAAFGGILRFIRLGQPHAVVFDETYYVKDAWTMLLTGEARNWPKYISKIPIDTLFASGHTGGWLDSAEYVVHPPLGKWLIAVGLQLFGGAGNIFAWRVSVAVAGTIAILLMCRVALRLFHNLPLAALAGSLMSMDGLAIVMSRTGILDNFIMVFALGAFLCLLIHRDWASVRLQEAYEVESHKASASFLPMCAHPILARIHPSATKREHYNNEIRWVLNSAGPQIFFSWPRVAATILLGFATGVKWSGAYFFAAFALLTVLWDAWERRRVGYRSWFSSAIWKDGIPAALYMVPIYIATYFADWFNWFIHEDSYLHNWAQENPGEGITWLPPLLRSFIAYHQEMWQFHTTLEVKHDYMANPLTWPLQIRPTSFYWERITSKTGLCSLSPSQDCIVAVSSVGNPAIWWLGSACVIAMVVMGIFVKRIRSDWKIWAVLIGFIGGWLPWAQYLNRTTFTFYSIVILPWIILGIIYMANLMRETVSDFTYHWVMGGVITIIIMIFAFFYPIWTAMPVPYQFWYAHMWLQSWI